MNAKTSKVETRHSNRFMATKKARKSANIRLYADNVAGTSRTRVNQLLCWPRKLSQSQDLKIQRNSDTNHDSTKLNPHEYSSRLDKSMQSTIILRTICPPGYQVSY